MVSTRKWGPRPKMVEDPIPSGTPQSMMELKLRKQLRSGAIKPTPKGRIVSGRLGDWNAPRQQCEGHVFITRKPIRNMLWQSGWQQGAHCLVCGDDIYPIDASWWLERASPQRIRLAMSLIRDEGMRLRRIYKRLEARL